MTSVLAPLLGVSLDGEGHQAGSTAHRAPLISRYLAALSAGHLPSNNQLYALFHRISSTLEGWAQDVNRQQQQPSTDGDQRVPSSDQRAKRALDPKTVQLCTEGAELCRDAARWLRGDFRGPVGGQVGGEEEAQASSTSDTARGRGKEPQHDHAAAPKGNSNEQLQRFFWFASSAGLHSHFDIDNPPIKELAQDTAKAAKEGVKDAAQGVQALARLVLLFFTSPELQNVIVDAVHLFRHVVADTAETVADKVGGVGEAVRPDHKPDPAEPKPKEELKDLGESAKEAVSAAAVEGGVKEAVKEYVDERTPESWIDEASERLGRMIDYARDDPAYVTAARSLVSLSEKYSEIIERTKQGVEQLIDVGVEESGAEGGKEAAVQGAIHSTNVDAGIKGDTALLEAAKAGREVLEGLAGGLSLDGILGAIRKLREDVTRDTGLKQWTDDARAFVAKSVQGLKDGEEGEEASTSTGAHDAFSSTGEAQEALKELLHRLNDIFKETPSFRDDVRALGENVSDFIEAVKVEPMGKKVTERALRVWSIGASALKGTLSGFKHEAMDIVGDFFHLLIPTFTEVLSSVPLPRVEFASDKVDAVVEDLVIPTLSLIPDHARVRTTADFSWTRHPAPRDASRNVDTSMLLSLTGFQVAVSDVSFYVEEKATAPNPGRCGGCCGCYGRYEDPETSTCLMRGPSSWFAYRESAVLDAGFKGQGLGFEIDIIDAGQEAERSGAGDGSVLAPAAMEDDLDDGRRQSFFVVRDVKVDASGSFDFHLKNSHHWIVNALIRPVARPIVRLVIQRVAGALMQHGFEKVDKAAWDVHARAFRVARERERSKARSKARWVGKEIRGEVEGAAAASGEGGASPTWRDYVKVLFNDKAGKSEARIRKERKEREEEERKKQGEEMEEEERQKRREEERQRKRAEQPKDVKTMQVGLTGVTKRDEDGEYALSVGIAPRVLPAHKRGPPTRHTKLRDDIVERRWKELAKRPVGRAQSAWDEADVGGGVQRVRETVQAGVDEVREVREGVQVVREHKEVETRGDTEAAKRGEEGWKSELFDL